MLRAVIFLAALTLSGAGGATATPTVSQLVGQHLIVRMPGRVPSADFLARIRRGEIGGVVLFQTNGGEAQLPSLIRTLQSAARAGGRLPLLIAIDQEGGVVKRLPGPPTLPPRAMTTPAIARAQGSATGNYLRQLGITIDLAPVLDVPASRHAFIYSRAFATPPAGIAFAQGLVAAGVGASAKHFPGLGRLVTSTDDAPGTVSASRAALERDLAPFRQAIAAQVPAIMVGTAVYPAYSGKLPAAASRGVVAGLLRGTLGYRGLVLTDDLDTVAVSHRIQTTEAAVRAIAAGVDMVYVAGVGGAGGPTIGEQTYAALLAAARSGRLSSATLEASYARIAAFKQRFG
jgi:beta-N-acetylhexosaminidase